MFAFNFLGPLSQFEVCDNEPSSVVQSLARVKIWGVSTPKGRNLELRKSPLGWVNMCAYNFLLVDQSFFAQ